MSYEEAVHETTHYLTCFDLLPRQFHLAKDLSGGEKRKLSVAIAVCAGSKFIILDEPTAGE